MVRPGYKQTEIGEIPEDWDIEDIQSISLEPMQNGLFFEPARKGKGIKLVNVGNLYDGSPIDGEKLELFDATDSEKKIFKVRDGDLFFTRSSVVPSGIAYCNIYLGKTDEDVVFDSHLIKLRVNQQVAHPNFIYLNCLSTAVRSYLVGSAKTATMTTIDQQAIKKCPVLLPRLTEQIAIAKALSDVDELIVSLEKLIAKKRDIKTATMQQLLTGKKRLPGFGEGKGSKQTELGEIPEDWDVKSYGEVFLFLTTASNSRDDLSENGEVFYVHYGDIHTKFDFQIDFETEYLPKIASEKLKSASFVQDGDLVMADASEDYEGIGKSVEVKRLLDKKAISGLHTFLLRDIGNVFALGYKGYLHSITPVKKSFHRLATGLKVYGLSKKNLKQVLVPVPPYEEQKEIIHILLSMDMDIEALESRLNKTKSIKQGMMQELLTGRTRLVDVGAHQVEVERLHGT